MRPQMRCLCGCGCSRRVRGGGCGLSGSCSCHVRGCLLPGQGPSESSATASRDGAGMQPSLALELVMSWGRELNTALPGAEGLGPWDPQGRGTDFSPQSLVAAVRREGGRTGAPPGLSSGVDPVFPALCPPPHGPGSGFPDALRGPARSFGGPAPLAFHVLCSGDPER